MNQRSPSRRFPAANRAIGLAIRPDPHHARLGATAALVYVATEVEPDPDEGPWALAPTCSEGITARARA